MANTVLNSTNVSKKATVTNLSETMQFNGWFILLDLGLLVAAVFMILSPAKVLFFHIIFILLTLGAFYWNFRPFAVRAIFWVAVTAIVVISAILAGQTQVEEIIEIPLLTSILILVFVIAEQRSSAQEALRQSEERYHTLFENLFKESIDAIFITDQKNKIVDVNQAMLTLFGAVREEIVGLNYQNIYLKPENKDTFQQEVEQNGFVRNQEVELRKADDTEMHCLLTSSVWRANDGSVLGYQGIVRDVTKRKQAEQQLRESEERYRRLVELAYEGVAIHSQGKFVYLNPPAVRIFGATNPQEIMGKQVLNFVHPDHTEIVEKRMQKANVSRVGIPPAEVKLLRVDGSSVDTEVAAVPIVYQGSPAIQTVIRDITPRKKAEAERERLLATEREQRALAETLGEVFLALSAQISYEAVIDEILRQVQRIVSHSAANIMLEKDGKLHIAHHKGYHTFGSRELVSNLEQSLADFPLDAEVVRSAQPLVVPNTHQNPHWVTVPESAWIKSFVAVPIRLRDQVLGLLRLDSDTPDKFSDKDVDRLHPLANAAAIALENARLYDKARQEIAERIQVEKELRKIAARNQAILDAIPDSILHLNRNGQILDYKIHGDNIISEIMNNAGAGKTLNDMPWLSSDLTDLFLHYIRKTLDTETMQIFEYQIRLPDDIRDFEAWLVVSSRNEVLAIVRDVTERKARESALRKERSRFARDLHDSLGQNLGYLRLKLDEFTIRDVSLPDTVIQELAKLQNVANEAYEIVRSMIAAARPSNSADLATVMLAQAQLASHRSGFEVKLTSNGHARPLLPIIQQQVLYIVQEALSNVEKHAHAGRVEINLDWQKDMLHINLSDDGCGFETNQSRPDGHYGLTIMQERAEEIQALLTLVSKPGGTRLQLQLPVAPVQKP